MNVASRQQWTGRLVTYGLVVALGFGVVQQVEAWPVTPLRLFSEVRTGETTMLELVAVDADGQRTVVRPYGEVAATVRLQYRELPTLSPADQLTEVRAWLDAAEMDVDGFTTVRLERVAKQLDPDGGPATVVSRTLVVEVTL